MDLEGLDDGPDHKERADEGFGYPYGETTPPAHQPKDNAGTASGCLIEQHGDLDPNPVGNPVRYRGRAGQVPEVEL
jgi:hypothetical protein